MVKQPIIIIIIISMGVWFVPTTARAEEPAPVVVTTWGSDISLDGRFNKPKDIALDDNNHIYVADTTNHRIQKFNSSGNHLLSFGTEGDGEGEFSFPNGIALDSNGNIYVADTSNHRIQKFNSAGEHLFSFGSKGSSDGQFNFPNGVAVDSGSTIFVADTENHRIQKFDSLGNHLLTFGSAGSNIGKFDAPTGLAVDKLDNLFVADSGNNRVQKFDSDGGFFSAFGTLGSGGGEFLSPTKLVVDDTGNIYVADRFNHRIQKLSSAGNQLLEIGTQGSSNSQFESPNAVAVDSNGNIYVVDTINLRVQKFNNSGIYSTKWGTDTTSNGRLNLPNGIAKDSGGNIYVVDSGNNRVQKYNAAGTYISRFGSSGSGNGQFDTPNGIAIYTPTNTIYIADTSNHRIQKFNSAGNFSLVIGSQGSGNGQLSFPKGVAVNNSGNVYVADTDNHRIQIFDSSGNYLTSFGSQGSADGQFNAPSGVAIDAQNRVYVADTGNHRIQRFSNTGGFQSKFGINGINNGELSSPNNLVIDIHGDIYVSDRANNRVQKFTDSGNFILMFGSQGINQGEFNTPNGLAVDGEDYIYVADTFNLRVQKFGYVPDIYVTKSVSPKIVNIKQNLSYLITIHNGGADIATDITLTDLMPEELTVTEVQEPAGLLVTRTNSSDYVWQIQDLQPGEGGTFTILGTLKDNVGVGTSITNQANLTTSANDPNDENNTDEVTVTVQNRLPTFISSPTLTAPLELTYTYNITVTDADSTTLTISAVTMPNWLTLLDHGAGMATLSGLPTITGTYTVTLVAKDTGGDTTEQTFQLKAFYPPNYPPKIISNPTTRALQGLTYQYHLTATDQNEDALVFTAPIKPTWLSLTDNGDNTALLQGTPTITGTYAISVVVQDTRSLTDTQTFELEVDEPHPPEFTSTPITISTRGRIYHYNINATDQEDSELTIRGVTMPDWLELTDFGDGSAVLLGTPNLAGRYAVTLQVIDRDGLVETQSFDIDVIIPPNNPPEITSQPIISGITGVAYAYTVTATDPDNDPLVMTAPLIPDWLNLSRNSNGSYLLAGTPNITGTYPVRLQLEDTGGLTDTQQFDITVTVPPNQPPQFTSTPITTATQDEIYQYAITTTDPDNNTLSISAPTQPTWLNLVDNGDGSALLSGTPTAVGSVTVVLVVADTFGVTDTQTFEILVNPPPNQPPTFTSEPLLTVIQGTLYEYHLMATDPESDTLTIVSLTKPAWLNLTDFGDGTAVLSGTPTITGEFDIIIQVEDSGGLNDIKIFTIKVNAPPNQPPLFTSTPVNSALRGVLYRYPITATDPESDTITISAPGKPTWLNLIDQGDGTALLQGTPTITGQVNINLIVQDAANLTTHQSFSLTISTPSPPIFPADTPTDPILLWPRGAVSLTNQALVFQWKTAESPTGIAFYTLQLEGEADLSSLESATVMTQHPIYTTTNPLPSGIYSWTVTAYDTLNQASLVVSPVQFTIPANTTADIYLPLVVKR